MATPKVTIYYLELTNRVAAKGTGSRLVVREQLPKQFSLNRFLYAWVGNPWHWNEKLSWDEQRWRAYAESDDLRTFVAYEDAAPAGYYELYKEGADVQIAYFGLAPSYIGRGLGRGLLEHAINDAWEWGASRIWVHTCTLDHPHALANYQARGFCVFKTEEVVRKSGAQE